MRRPLCVGVLWFALGILGAWLLHKNGLAPGPLLFVGLVGGGLGLGVGRRSKKAQKGGFPSVSATHTSSRSRDEAYYQEESRKHLGAGLSQEISEKPAVSSQNPVSKAPDGRKKGKIKNPAPAPQQEALREKSRQDLERKKHSRWRILLLWGLAGFLACSVSLWRASQDPYVDLVDQTITVSGVVLKESISDSTYGTQYKYTVRTDDGWRLLVYSYKAPTYQATTATRRDAWETGLFTTTVARLLGRGEVQTELLSTTDSTATLTASLSTLLGYEDIPAIDTDLETAVGRRLTVTGQVYLPQGQRNPHCFDYAAYLQGQKIHALLSASQVTVGTVKRPVLYAVASLRQAFQSTLSAYLTEDQMALLNAMVFGDKSGLKDEEYALYQRNGTAHVLAVSGLHVSLVYSLFLRFQKKKRSKKSSLWIFLGLLFYATLAGFTASVVRAVLMISLQILAGLRHCRYDMPSATAMAALLLLVYEPLNLFQTGFQMSFLAVGLLSFLLPAVERRILPHLMRRWAARLPLLGLQLLESLVQLFLPLLLLQVCLMPYTVYVFNYLSLSAFVANYPLVLLAGLLVPVALVLFILLVPLTLLGGALFETLGQGVLLPLGGKLCGVLLELLDQWNLLSYADGRFSFDVVSPPLFVVAIFYGRLVVGLSEGFVVLRLRRQYVQCAARILGIGGLCFLLAVGMALSTPSFSGATFVFVDVGQGACIHVQAGGMNILIDGGGSDTYDLGSNTLRPYLLKNGVRRVDLAIVTHTDTDHYAGIRSLCQLGMVKKLALYEGHQQELATIMAETGMAQEDILFLKKGDTLGQEDSQGIFIQVLGPVESSSEENANCLVMQVAAAGLSLLVTGDMATEQEEILLRTYSDLSCDILQVGHHGSRYSSSAAFLQSTHARLAVIPVGRNTYGHPTEETLERLAAAGMVVYRTDTQGAVGIRGVNAKGGGGLVLFTMVEENP